MTRKLYSFLLLGLVAPTLLIANIEAGGSEGEEFGIWQEYKTRPEGCPTIEFMRAMVASDQSIVYEFDAYEMGSACYAALDVHAPLQGPNWRKLKSFLLPPQGGWSTFENNFCKMAGDLVAQVKASPEGLIRVINVAEDTHEDFYVTEHERLGACLSNNGRYIFFPKRDSFHYFDIKEKIWHHAKVPIQYRAWFRSSTKKYSWAAGKLQIAFEDYNRHTHNGNTYYREFRFATFDPSDSSWTVKKIEQEEPVLRMGAITNQWLAVITFSKLRVFDVSTMTEQEVPEPPFPVVFEDPLYFRMLSVGDGFLVGARKFSSGLGVSLYYNAKNKSWLPIVIGGGTISVSHRFGSSLVTSGYRSLNNDNEIFKLTIPSVRVEEKWR